MRTPGTITPPRYSPLGEMQLNVVAVPKSTTMVPVLGALVRGHGVGDAIGADLARTVVQDGDARLEAGAEHERLAAKQAPHHRHDAVGELGHHGRDDGRGDRLHADAALRERLHEQHAVLVLRTPLIRWQGVLCARAGCP